MGKIDWKWNIPAIWARRGTWKTVIWEVILKKLMENLTCYLLKIQVESYKNYTYSFEYTNPATYMKLVGAYVKWLNYPRAL